MESRRDFLKAAATGALLLGAQSKLGLAAALDTHAPAGKSKVVVARDAALHGADGTAGREARAGTAGPRHRHLHGPR